MKINFLKEKKEENKVIKIAVLILFVISLLFFVITMIRKAFNKSEPYYLDNISEYIISENLILDKKFYVLDEEVANFLEAVEKEMYNELYNIHISSYSNNYSRAYIKEILQEYRKDIFKYDDNDENKYIGHLLNAYKIENGKYLLQLDFNNGQFFIVIQEVLKGYNFTIVE